jgi:chromosome segregation ATPase
MNRPVTRTELQEELARFPTRAELAGEVGPMKSDIAVLKTDVSVLKTDVSVLKTDVSVLKTDVSVLKTDVSDLKSDNVAFHKLFAVIIERMEDLGREMKAVRGEMKAMERRLMAELARLTRVGQEWLADQVRVVDDKYKELPPRVTRLEAAVFPRKRRR